jgi:SulP family sulfate permease
MQFAFIEAWRAGLFARHHWLPNIFAGVVVGIVALPLALAFAIASGVRPEQGLYTAIVAGFLAAIFGGSRYQISGPTGAFIVILADISAHYGVDGLQIATLMAGVILVLMGISKFGAVVKFIPLPVIVGFTSGIAVIIWVGQWKDFFGLAPIAGQHFHEKLWLLLQQLPQFHWATTGLALLGLIILITAAKFPKLNRIPAPLTVLVVLTLFQDHFHFSGVATIGSTFGAIPANLPSFQLPHIDVSTLIMLLGPAFTIAMLGAIESLLSATVADGMTATKHRSNQELVGQGIANVAAPLFGGIAATGAIARTATNIKNGATGPLAGIIHAVTLVLIIWVAAPLAEHIPLAALAAILFVVAYNMSEWRHFVHILSKGPREDGVLLVLTFLLTVFADLVVAVNVGVVLAALLFMRRMAKSISVSTEASPALQIALTQAGLTQLPKGVEVYHVDGPLFFGAVEHFVHALQITQQPYNTLVIDLSDVPFVDITAILALQDMVQQLNHRAVDVVFFGAKQAITDQLLKAGFASEHLAVRFVTNWREVLL